MTRQYMKTMGTGQASLETLLVIACMLSVAGGSFAAMNHINSQAEEYLKAKQLTELATQIQNDSKIISMLGNGSTKTYNLKTAVQIFAESGKCHIAGQKNIPLDENILCAKTDEKTKTLRLEKTGNAVSLTG